MISSYVTCILCYVVSEYCPPWAPAAWAQCVVRLSGVRIALVLAVDTGHYRGTGGSFQYKHSNITLISCIMASWTIMLWYKPADRPRDRTKFLGWWSFLHQATFCSWVKVESGYSIVIVRCVTKKWWCCSYNSSLQSSQLPQLLQPGLWQHQVSGDTDNID